MRELVKRVPIVGYLARWALDLCRLPIVREDLHRDICALRSDIEEFRREMRTLEANLGSPLDKIADLHAFQHSSRGLARSLRALKRADGAFERRFRALEDRLDAPATDVAGAEPPLFQPGQGPEPEQLPSPQGEPVIANPQRLLRLAGQLRLNLSSRPLVDYLNVTEEEAPGADLSADYANLPFEPAGVSEIRVERSWVFGTPDADRVVLRHWYNLLAPGGVLRVVQAPAGLSGGKAPVIESLLRDTGFELAAEGCDAAAAEIAALKPRSR